MQEAAGTQSEITYIVRQQATVSQWVALRSMFEVCAREKGYKGGWSQEVGLVVTRGDRETTSVHPGRNLAGG